MNDTAVLITCILCFVGFLILLLCLTLFIDHKVNKETEEENKEDHHNNIHKNNIHKRNWNTYD